MFPLPPTAARRTIFLRERVVWAVDGGASNVTRSIRAVKEDYCIKIKLVD